MSLDNLILGATAALTLYNLFYCLVGVSLGMFVGILPGIGALATIALLLPFTYYLEPMTAIVMLGGVYYGTAYGGSVASILLNVPGSPSAAVACLDGYPMSKQGRGGVALFLTAVASFLGGSIGIIIMMLFSPIIVEIALSFRAAEYFTMMTFGLMAASTIGVGSPFKGIAMVVLGVLLGIVGTDVNTGMSRYTFGIVELYEGISLVAIALGLFGFSEVITSIREFETDVVKSSKVSLRSMVPTRDDMRRFWMPMLRGSGIGSLVGVLPGAGGSIASFMAYALEIKVSKEPGRFGKGAVEGVVSPEASNNACDQTAFIPTLLLGVPGSAVMALILGALMIHGVAPGPNFIIDRPDMFWGLIISFWVGNLMLLIMNIPLIGIWMRILTIPYKVLYPTILMFMCMGVYCINNSTVDVLMILLFGVAGYVMKLLEFSAAPLLLGFILGPMIEENMRRALVISGGDFGTFVERPISIGFVSATVLLLIWTLWTEFGRRWRVRKLQQS